MKLTHEIKTISLLCLALICMILKFNKGIDYFLSLCMPEYKELMRWSKDDVDIQ